MQTIAWHGSRFWFGRVGWIAIGSDVGGSMERWKGIEVKGDNNSFERTELPFEIPGCGACCAFSFASIACADFQSTCLLKQDVFEGSPATARSPIFLFFFTETPLQDCKLQFDLVDNIFPRDPSSTYSLGRFRWKRVGFYSDLISRSVR